MMILTANILGLPISTLLIVGGLFLLSALSPTILAIYLKKRGGWKDE